MKHPLFLYIIFIFGLISGAKSQTVTITDYNTKTPIFGVHIYNLDETKAVVTDTLGQADISVFSDDELIVFSHTSYTQVLFRKHDLYTSRYNLQLHPVVLNLDEFVISANKRIQAKEEVPNKLVSITAADIKLEDPQTAADMISQTGQVFVQKSQLGGGSPMIRGFAANKVLIVVDGVRMNNAIFRSGNLQNIISIDPNVIEKSEIIFGPGSVIYGSDALGGVMDFNTIEPRYSDSNMLVSGNVMARFSSANNEVTPHGDIMISTKKFSSVTSISGSRFNDLKMGSNGPDEYLRLEYVTTENGVDKIVSNPNPESQVYSGYTSFSVMQKFGFKVSEKLRINYNFLLSNTSNYSRYDRLIQRTDNDTLKYARWEYGPQKWMMNNLSINLNNPNTLFDNLRITLAVQNFEESRIDRKFESSTERNRTEKVDMYSVNLDFDNALSGRSTVFYGFESVFNKVHSTGFSTENGISEPIQTRYPDGSTYWSNAAYLSVKVNQSKKNTVVFGARYNQIIIDAVLDTTFYKNTDSYIINQNTGAFTGSIGLAHRPNDKWQVNLNFSSGFKAPNIDDIAKVFESEPGKLMVPNTDLSSEYLYTLDGLVSKKFGKNEAYKIELSGFYSFLVDAMVRRNVQVNGQDSVLYEGDLLQAQSLVNTGSANLAGVSINLEATINKKWKLTGSGTYTYGKDDEGFYLRHVAPIFSNVHVIYHYKKVRVNAYVNMNGSLPNARMSPSETGKTEQYLRDENGQLYSPSWYTLNIKSAIDMSKKIMFTLGVENITNQRYQPYSSGIVAPGINFIGAIKATF